MHVVHIGILGDVVASILADLLHSGNLAAPIFLTD